MIIEKNQRFQIEYKNFSERISNISDIKIKSELENDLKSLANEVRLVDQLHQDLLFQKNLSASVGDSKHKIMDIRKKILKKLEGWEKSSIRSKQNS